jgi:hypothetical protein
MHAERRFAWFGVEPNAGAGNRTGCAVRPTVGRALALAQTVRAPIISTRYAKISWGEKTIMLPDYWLQRPKLAIDPQHRLDFDQLLARVKAAGANLQIDYNFPVPKWQFLCYLADQHGVVLHGTGDPRIEVFEPRLSNDLNEFGAQTAIYAAGDGLWPMFFAILDRARYPMSTSNACIRLVDEAGHVSEPRYVFSISRPALRQQPWRTGMVYLLPGETFVSQPSLRFGLYEVRVPQLASLVPVAPWARLAVAPEDFPFLNDVRGHDDTRLAEYGQAMQAGAPWPD